MIVTKKSDSVQDKRASISPLFRHANSQTLCHHPTFNQALGISSDFRQIDMVHQKDMANIIYIGSTIRELLPAGASGCR